MYWSGHKGLKNLIYLVLIVVPLFSFGLTNHGLWSADEPRVAEIGREMALTGNWAVPMLNQRPFLEEPPLYYGTLALTFKALGVSDRVARIPSAIFAFATVLVLFFTVNFLFGPQIALFSGIILATTGEYFRVAHTVIVDSALTFFIACAMSLFIVGYLSDSNRKKLLCYILLYISCTFAFYTKGFIGIVIPGLGILSFLVADKNIKEIIKMRLWLGILIFLVLTLPWFITLWQQGGKEHLDVFLLHNHLQRFLPGKFSGTISGEASGHHHPFYYYLIEFPVGFLPWSLLLVPVFIHAFSRSDKSETPPEKGRLLAKCWFFAGIVFLSAASTKRTLYLMPLFAPMALLTSLYVESTLYRLTDKIEKAFLWAFTAIFAVIGISAVPVYSSIQGIYPWIRGTNLFPSTVLLSLLIVPSSVLAMWFLWSKNFGKYWVTTIIPIVVGMVFTAVAVAPVVDIHKSFVPFCHELMAIVPSSEPLYAYSADETLRGAVPFYTGRYLTEICGPGNLEKTIETKGQVFIITRDKKRKAETELLSTGKLSIIFQQKMGGERTLTLLGKNSHTVQSDIHLAKDN
ncbi:MAG: Undecaprenyl phosphate-alpha-4-amino-4-deoxy-L-arabinose arabinosyl transferase [Deltaproteobacteria bacterium ADurb.Bin135]|nr:MAG: Undecaprenyl phosphate-alpha-4-amino-4-deoxy-L-arabinose arabinosyl transferase [Deltaproteobacteria bacterium ADurb.Bin135]